MKKVDDLKVSNGQIFLLKKQFKNGCRFSAHFFLLTITLKNFVRTLIHFQHTLYLPHTKKMRKNFYHTLSKKFKFWIKITLWKKFFNRNHTFFRVFFWIKITLWKKFYNPNHTFFRVFFDSKSHLKKKIFILNHTFFKGFF